MIKVFVSGSMSIRNLDEKVLERLDSIISHRYWIIVGDADGVDASIQQHLSQLAVERVTVYCVGEEPRNNVGQWDTERVASNSKSGTREFFRAKDLKMADDCDYGLMVWDSKSTGTLNNAIELLARGKKSLVFVNKLREFAKIACVEDLEELVRIMSETAFKKADAKLGLTKRVNALKFAQREIFSDSSPF